MNRQPKTERNLQVVTDHQSGMTLQQIGDKHSITRERVRQLLCRQGIIERNYKQRKVHTKVCPNCAKSFETKRQDTVYCSKLCHRGGSRNRSRKLSDSQLSQIRKLYYEDDLTGKEIAKMYDVHYTTIYHFLAGRTFLK